MGIQKKWFFLFFLSVSSYADSEVVLNKEQILIYADQFVQKVTQALNNPSKDEADLTGALANFLIHLEEGIERHIPWFAKIFSPFQVMRYEKKFKGIHELEVGSSEWREIPVNDDLIKNLADQKRFCDLHVSFEKENLQKTFDKEHCARFLIDVEHVYEIRYSIKKVIARFDLTKKDHSFGLDVQGRSDAFKDQAYISFMGFVKKSSPEKSVELKNVIGVDFYFPVSEIEFTSQEKSSQQGEQKKKIEKNIVEELNQFVSHVFEKTKPFASKKKPSVKGKEAEYSFTKEAIDFLREDKKKENPPRVTPSDFFRSVVKIHQLRSLIKKNVIPFIFSASKEALHGLFYEEIRKNAALLEEKIFHEILSNNINLSEKPKEYLSLLSLKENLLEQFKKAFTNIKRDYPDSALHFLDCFDLSKEVVFEKPEEAFSFLCEKSTQESIKEYPFFLLSEKVHRDLSQDLAQWISKKGDKKRFKEKCIAFLSQDLDCFGMKFLFSLGTQQPEVKIALFKKKSEDLWRLDKLDLHLVFPKKNLSEYKKMPFFQSQQFADEEKIKSFLEQREKDEQIGSLFSHQAQIAIASSRKTEKNSDEDVKLTLDERSISFSYHDPFLKISRFLPSFGIADFKKSSDYKKELKENLENLVLFCDQPKTSLEEIKKTLNKIDFLLQELEKNRIEISTVLQLEKDIEDFSLKDKGCLSRLIENASVGRDKPWVSSLNKANRLIVKMKQQIQDQKQKQFIFTSFTEVRDKKKRLNDFLSYLKTISPESLLKNAQKQNDFLQNMQNFNKIRPSFLMEYDLNFVLTQLQRETQRITDFLNTGQQSSFLEPCIRMQKKIQDISADQDQNHKRWDAWFKDNPESWLVKRVKAYQEGFAFKTIPIGKVEVQLVNQDNQESEPIIASASGFFRGFFSKIFGKKPSLQAPHCQNLFSVSVMNEMKDEKIQEINVLLKLFYENKAFEVDLDGFSFRFSSAPQLTKKIQGDQFLGYQLSFKGIESSHALLNAMARLSHLKIDVNINLRSLDSDRSHIHKIGADVQFKGSWIAPFIPWILKWTNGIALDEKGINQLMKKGEDKINEVLTQQLGVHIDFVDKPIQVNRLLNPNAL
jgi:hypothetical protein